MFPFLSFHYIGVLIFVIIELKSHQFPDATYLLQQVEVDIEQKELLVQKTNLRLTKALQDENDRRACYKEFIGMNRIPPYYSHLC